MPGLKREVYEFCPKCGAQDAELRDGGMLWWGLHKCEFAVPGKHRAPPRWCPIEEVIFVRVPGPILLTNESKKAGAPRTAE